MTENTFAAAAAAEATTPTVAEVDENALVQLFLSGVDAFSGDYQSTNRVLLDEGSPIARLAKDGSVLLPTDSHYNVAFNDKLLTAMAVRGTTFRRLNGFGNLTNANQRLREVDNGQFEDFKAIAGLFDFSVSEDDLAAVTRAKAFRSRVQEFFTDLQTAERERIAAAEKIAREERARKAAITWDDGDGDARNNNVQGAGGGQRLRIQKNGTGRTTKVETSTGQTLTLKQAERAFRFATQYWHGTKTLRRTYRADEPQATLAARNYGGYATTVKANKLSFGCQTITREEAERFADSQGWARAAEPTVAVAA